MTEHKTFPGKTYCVTCAEDCTVSDSTGTLSMECEAGKQLHVTAPSDKLFTSASAIVREVFNLAPAKLKALGLLGGGAPALPAGYLAAEFLESTGYENSFHDYQCPHFVVSAPKVEETDVWQFVTVHRVNFSTGKAQVEGVNAGGTVQSMFYGVTAGKKLYASSSFESTTNSEISVNEQKYAFGFKQKGQHAYVVFDGREIKLNSNITIIPAEIGIFGALKRGNAGYFYPFNGKKYSWKFIKNGKVIFNLIPVLDANGIPCMFDKASNKALYNAGAGAFIAGFTIDKARKLSKLPSGTKLTISLPSNYMEDDGVVEALLEAEEKGCVLTIQAYAESDTSATYSMRRIWVKRIERENGPYVSQDGTRYGVEWCVDIIGSTPETEGYEPFHSVEAATEFWGLEPYADPAWEEELLTTDEQ